MFTPAKHRRILNDHGKGQNRFVRDNPKRRKDTFKLKLQQPADKVFQIVLFDSRDSEEIHVLFVRAFKDNLRLLDNNNKIYQEF